MRLLILDENYPHLNNTLGDVFVHVRAKEYAKTHEVKAFSFFHEPCETEYEGIPLQTFNEIDKLVVAIKAYRPDKILIHFYHSWMLESFIREMNVPVIIWVHGYEALGWYRRLFNYTWYSPVLLNYIRSNTRQQYHFHKLIRYANTTGKVYFVFVSEWMKRITEQDALGKIKNSAIVPNPIDTQLFQYKEKHPDLRKKVLLLRSFNSKKYANDISVKAIIELSRSKAFQDFSFTIRGAGPLFERTLSPIRNFDNVQIEEKFVRQVHIPQIHQEHGVFLCPTRQDAQGVSMCEAMSSGLVPITSNNTAIPEFVTGNVSGILTKSAGQIAAALEELLQHPEKFQKLSAEAAKAVRDLCDIRNVSAKELSIIEL